MADATPFNVLQPPATTSAQSLADRKRAFSQAVQKAMQEGFNGLLELRRNLRAMHWSGTAGFSPEQAWDAHGTAGPSIATVAGELDEFLEAVLPGCTAGDVGVPADYSLTPNAAGGLTCSEKAAS